MMTFAEFFAGVGLIREGLSIDNWSCVWANDISIDKKDTYVENYGDEHFCLADIWDIVGQTHTIPDDVFLYTASFPCTDLSVAGARAGLAGKKSGSLAALLAILAAKRQMNTKPKVVLLENVKGFLTSHKGKDVVDTVSQLSELGYYVDLLEIDAINFTPQSRPRVFVIAVDEKLAPSVMALKQVNNDCDKWQLLLEGKSALRSDKIRDVMFNNSQLNWGLIDVTLANKRTSQLIDIIETQISNDSALWWVQARKDHLFAQMSEGHKIKLGTMLEGDRYSYGTVFRRTRNGKPMAELRTDGIAGCLRTPGGGSSKQILIRAGFGHWDVRLLSPRECARLQGVRDDFSLPENANKSYFAMGDAVCVPVIEFLASNVFTPIYHSWVNAERL